MKDIEIGHLGCGIRATNHVASPRQQVLFPFRDLGGMHAKLCPQLRQRLVALDRGEGDRCLNCRTMIVSRSLYRLAPLVSPPFGDVG